jgi:hypothetical protein
MARPSEPLASRQPPVEATTLGSTILAPPVREQLAHPDPAPAHAVAKENAAEATLARARIFWGAGQFGPALSELAKLDPGATSLSERYRFLSREKQSRAQIGVAERYVARGDQKSARAFYLQALQTDGAEAAVRDW